MKTLTAQGERVVIEARREAQTKSGRAYCSIRMVVTVREYLAVELGTGVFGN